MRNILCLIVTTVIFIGSYIAFQGSISQNALLFIGIVIGIAAIGVVVSSIHYPKHRGPLALSICGFILLFFVPVFAALGDISSPLTTGDFTRYVLTFSIASIILIGTIILSYRYYFILKD